MQAATNLLSGSSYVTDTSGHAAPRPCSIKLRPCRTTFRHCTRLAASTVSAARQQPSWVDTSCHCQRPPAHSGAAGTPGNTNLSTAVRFPNAHLSAHCCGSGDAAVLPLLLDDSDYLATHPSCIQGSKPGYRAQRSAPRKHRPVSQCGSLISCCSGQGVCSYHDHQVHRCSPGRPLTRGPRAAGRATSISWLRHC